MNSHRSNIERRRFASIRWERRTLELLCNHYQQQQHGSICEEEGTIRLVSRMFVPCVTSSCGVI